MFKQIVTPTDTELVLHIPKELVGHEVEVNVVETRKRKTRKKKNAKSRNDEKYENFLKFIRKNSIEFPKDFKFNREELYDR